MGALQCQVRDDGQLRPRNRRYPGVRDPARGPEAAAGGGRRRGRLLGACVRVLGPAVLFAPASLQQDQKEGDYRLRNTSGLKLCPPSQNLTGELVPWLTASPFSLHPRCNPLQGFWEVKLRFQGYIRGPFRVFAVLLVRRCNTRTCRAVRRP